MMGSWHFFLPFLPASARHLENEPAFFHCHTFFHFTWLRIVIPSLRSHIGKLLYVPSYAAWG